MMSHDTIRIAHGQDETYRASCDMHRMETPAERLKKARELRGYATPTEAAEAFGWSAVTYRSHENGTRGLKPEVADRYAKALRVAAAWILYGDGIEPETDGAPPQPAQKPYVVEPNAVWEQGPFVRPATYGPRDIEELGITVGGDGEDDSAFEFNGQVIDYVKRPIGILDRKDVFALRVSNSSMEPKYEDGERVYVEKRRPAIRDFVVVELKPREEGRAGKSFIKRLVAMDAAKITVEQYNPRGLLEFGRHEVKTLYRVIPERELRGEV